MQHIKILSMILPVVAMIVIGAICGKKKIFDREGLATIKKFAVNIALTAVVFNAFATAEYSLKSIVIPAIMFIVCIIALYFGELLVRMDSKNSRYLPYMLTGFEAGMLGYTLYGILYGADISSFALVDLGQVLFVFTFYKISLTNSLKTEPQPPELNYHAATSETNESDRLKEAATSETSESDRVKQNLNTAPAKSMIIKEIFTSPIILGILAGIIIGATGIYNGLEQSGTSQILDAVVGFIAAPTSALILFSIGFDLVSGKIQWGNSLKYTLIRYLLMLVLGAATLFAVSLLFDMSQALKRAIILMFMMPPPFVLPIFADDPKEQSTIASMLSISTLVTLIGFVVLAATGI